MTAVSLLVLSLLAVQPTGHASGWAAFPSGESAQVPDNSTSAPAAPAEDTAPGSSTTPAAESPAAAESAPAPPAEEAATAAQSPASVEGTSVTETAAEAQTSPAAAVEPASAVSSGRTPSRTRSASARSSTRAASAAQQVAPQPAPATPVLTAEPLPGISGTPVRVENRILVKERRFFATAGLSYLFRGDYYLSPAISGTGSFFLDEGHGLEAKLDVFVSFLAPGASEVFNALGLVPDSHRPVARLSAGYRNAMAYGKVMAFGAFLLHFDLHAAAHLGFLFTDREVAPSLSLGPGFLVKLNQSLYLQFDLPVFVSFERRQSGLVSAGVMPAITLGIRP